MFAALALKAPVESLAWGNYPLSRKHTSARDDEAVVLLGDEFAAPLAAWGATDCRAPMPLTKVEGALTRCAMCLVARLA